MDKHNTMITIDPMTQMVISENDCYIEGNDTSNEEEADITPFDPKKIRVENRVYQLQYLITKMSHDEIDLKPEFQRESEIWTDKAQSSLIESILLKIPIPAFYIDQSNDEKWLVIDGLQRLTTLFRFLLPEQYKELFPKGKPLKLCSLKSLKEYNGFAFKDLPRPFQRRIEETQLIFYAIQEGTPEEVKYDIFRRINTGGLPLNQQEIRHVLNRGIILKYLKEMAESDEFLTATAKGVSPKRMDDKECALRFLTFISDKYKPENYRNKDFDEYLNESMAYLNTHSTETLEQLKQKFITAMKRATELFGDRAFRKMNDTTSTRGIINKALFEAWSVNLAKLGQEEYDRLFDRREELIKCYIALLKNDREYMDSVSFSTGSPQKVMYRFKRTNSLIEEVINEEV